MAAATTGTRRRRARRESERQYPRAHRLTRARCGSDLEDRFELGASFEQLLREAVLAAQSAARADPEETLRLVRSAMLAGPANVSTA